MDSQPTPTFNLKKEAQRVFDSVLLDEPFNFLALYGKALTLYKDGQMEKCIETMNKAIQLEPSDSESNAKDLRDKIQQMYQTRNAHKATGKLDQVKTNTVHQPIAGHKIGQKQNLIEPIEKSHHCKICDKNFTKQFSLNRHMLLHTGEKPHKCNICRRAFIQKTDMERHETTHSDVLNFQCTMCDKRFKTKKNLTCHLVTHSVNRPYKCSYCEKDFKVKRLWRFHEGLHKDTKPYNCDICGKGFPAKPYIKSHLKTHIDEKPFVCSICNFGFKRNYDLNFHVRNQHQKI